MDREHARVKGRRGPVLSGSTGGAWGPALVLLFELELYSSCSTSYVQLAVNRQPGYRQGTRRAALVQKKT